MKRPRRITVRQHRLRPAYPPPSFLPLDCFRFLQSFDMSEEQHGLKKWKDCAAVYPSAEEIAIALQDEGQGKSVKEKGSQSERYRYPLIDKLARKIYTSIQKHFNNPEGLTKNVSRGKESLYKEIILGRKLMELSEVPPFFHKFAGKEGRVYVITTSTVHLGMDVILDRFQDSVIAAMQQKNSARTPNDGLRLACIMLDAKYRGSVNGTLLKKKTTRKMSDIKGNPVTHFFEMILDEAFSNADYKISQPPYFDEFPQDERETWDPNDSAIFDHKRTGEWLRATWDDYVRPKYKKALDKWNKETGGGDGTPPSFIDFCAGDRWLVWVFCCDHSCNFLLACSAGGRMPSHLLVESGFDVENSSSSISALSSEDDSKRPRNPATTRRNIEDEINSAKRQRVHSLQALETMTEYIKYKHEQEKKQHDQQVNTNMNKKNILQEVRDVSKMMVETELLDTFSPDSRSKYLDELKQQRKSLLQQLSSERQNADDGPSSSD